MTSRTLTNLKPYSIIISADGSYTKELIKRRPAVDQSTIIFANSRTSSNYWNELTVSSSYEFAHPELLSTEFNWRSFDSLPVTQAFELNNLPDLWQTFMTNQTGEIVASFNSKTDKVLMGLPLTSQDNSWVYHPAFLFFLEEFMVNNQPSQGQLHVGDSQLAKAVFGDFSEAEFAKLGSKPATIANDSDIYFYEPGIYEFNRKLETSYLPVNFKLFNTELYSTNELEKRLGLKIVSPEMHQKTWRIGSENRQQLYDLAPIIIIIVLGLFAFEEVALIITWFRKRL